VFPSAYLGKYLFADFCGQWIYYIIDPASPGAPPNLRVGFPPRSI